MQQFNEDVIGKALLAYLDGDSTPNIIVKSSFGEDTLSIPYLFRTAKQLPKIEKTALKLCKGKVLDVGAGSGCHSLILQKRKMNVKAIDVSKGAVEVMMKRKINAFHIDFHEETNQFDTLLFLMNGVGIAGTIKGLKKLLKKAKILLNVDGQILLDSSDISYMFTEDDGSMKINLNAPYYGEVSFQMQYKDIKTQPFDWLFIDFELLENIAKPLGYKCELIINGPHFDYLAKLSLK
ncbi:MAG: SAM-dependent methyltransferase [Flavobacteriales bacterium CG_4_9_14_3_um_filter_32_8]|nr:MAG: SAM-dependent methyltransferase [Flavobacteriales bacterium CG_4_9_14_3_um_filter_32_8]